MGNCPQFSSSSLEQLESSYSETSSLMSTPDTPRKAFLRSYDEKGNSESARRRDAELHYQSGGAGGCWNNVDFKRGSSPWQSKNGTKRVADDDEERVVGLEESDSGIHSRGSLTSPKKSSSHPSSSFKTIVSSRGKALFNEIKHAYQLKKRFDEPKEEFLREMDKLFMNVQLHLTDLSGSTLANHKEADSLVEELIALRNHWGSNLLPNTVCNAFVRERIHITVNNIHYRIDCAQFFEPVPYYTTPVPSSGELMKLYRFSVYETNRNEVVMRYYLERSNVIQLYHVLCYSCGNERGQVYPYGLNCPSYWVLRDNMLTDVCTRLKYL